MKYLLLFIWFTSHVAFSCQAQIATAKGNLRNYDSLASIQVMILGTYHFAQEQNRDELTMENQEQLDKLAALLQPYQANKVVIEKEHELTGRYNEYYQMYRKGDFVIDTLSNEIFQLGFRLAGKMRHDSIYLFDNHPPFIGSLTDFSFQAFEEYARANDAGFYDEHLKKIMSIYEHNEKILKSQNLKNEIVLRNSEQMTRINKQRMHAYEIRVGIQKNWMGADWLARWYQRNLRMAANLLRMSKPGDRLLVIAGDNHKWILEQLLGNIPDFEVVDVNDYIH